MAAVGFAAMPMMLVFLQPDFGTAIVYAGILGATLFIAGHALVAGGDPPDAVGAVIATFVLWVRACDRRRRAQGRTSAKRITGFTHPTRIPAARRTTSRSRSPAVGAGGVDGRGPNGATQTNYNYLARARDRLRVRLDRRSSAASSA